VFLIYFILYHQVLWASMPDVIVVLSRLKEQETFVPILPFPYLGLVTGHGPRVISGPFSALF
jgi:hypothetical protein